MIEKPLKSRTIIPTTMSWKTVMEKRWNVHEEYMKKHQETYDNDYDYVGNISVDLEAFSSLQKKAIYIGSKSSKGPLTYLDMFIFKTDSSILNDIKSQLGLRHCTGAAQTLSSGKTVLAHFDSASLEENPEKITVLTEYYRKLVEIYPNLEEFSVDRVFNTFILFVDEWKHGQSFMVGRQSFTCWKPGDVITFPWYMIHSTANASFSDDRLLLYLAGFIE